MATGIPAVEIKRFVNVAQGQIVHVGTQGGQFPVGQVTGRRCDKGVVENQHLLLAVRFVWVFAGQTVAIVGQTGAGKSTLTKLINRTYDAREGRVLIDGVDARDWSLAALRRQTSIIEQDIFLFSRTIAENIAFGAPEATPAEIEAAAKAAGLGYIAIPITHQGFTEAQVAAMGDALDAAGGPVLAFCRSGTRSTLVWALAQGRAGGEFRTLARKAEAAGYDLSPIRGFFG